MVSQSELFDRIVQIALFFWVQREDHVSFEGVADVDIKRKDGRGWIILVLYRGEEVLWLWVRMLPCVVWFRQVRVPPILGLFQQQGFTFWFSEWYSLSSGVFLMIILLLFDCVYAAFLLHLEDLIIISVLIRHFWIVICFVPWKIFDPGFTHLGREIRRKFRPDWRSVVEDAWFHRWISQGLLWYIWVLFVSEVFSLTFIDFLQQICFSILSHLGLNSRFYHF